jgi:hypothetical protein
VRVNDFRQNNEWQLHKRDKILVPFFYEKYYAGRYRFANAAEQRAGIDTIVQGKNGPRTIEEKIVEWIGEPYRSFALETESCTLPGSERDGWMKTGTAQLLLYCFENQDGDLDPWLIAFQELKDWFWPVAESFYGFHLEERNRSRGRVVPIRDVVAAVWTKQLPLLPNSRCERCTNFGEFGYRVKDRKVLDWLCNKHQLSRWYADARRDPKGATDGLQLRTEVKSG